MAYTEIHPVKSTLKKALDYIMDENKTDGLLLVSSFGCSPDTADLEFDFTLGQARRGGPNLAHHLIQSFAPGETTPEQAHEIGRQLADETLGGKYEYVLTTHIDKGHIHNHVIFCAASFVDHRKYVSNKKTLTAIRRTSDRLCRENGLTTIIPSRDDGKGSIEYSAPDGERRTRPAQERGRTRAASGADKSSGSYRNRLRAAIDHAIPQANDYDNLIAILEADGYEVKRGKHISFRAPGQERFTRMKSLGEGYTEQAVQKRIADAGRPAQKTKETKAETGTARTIRPQDRENVSLLIDIEHSVKAQESKGYEKWAARFNLKQKAATLNYMAKHGIETYDDLRMRRGECAAAAERARAAVKGVERKMSEVAITMKNVNIVEKTKPVYAAYRHAKDKAQFRRAHEGDIILHEAAARALKAAGHKRPPDAAALAKEYARLGHRKGKLYAEYGRAKRKLKEVDVIKKNVDSVLAPPKVIGHGLKR
jgi:hypothetical protein